MLWVYADFIKPTIVGDCYAPILRLAPIQSKLGVLSHSIFALQHYIPVKRAKIQEFGIQICEQFNGPPIKIYDTAIITLHFRKRG